MAEVNVPNPGPGEVLVRNSYMTVDPYMRGRMVDRKSYVPPFQIGEALQGGRADVLVATKARLPMGEGPNDAGLSRHHLISACEASLRRLRRDHIDLAGRYRRVRKCHRARAQA